MCKSFKQKFQFLNRNTKQLLTIILTILIVFFIGFVSLFIKYKKQTSSKAITSQPRKETGIPKGTPENLKPGQIGEPKAGEEPKVNLPNFIFTTEGVIKNIQQDRITVLGKGSNFSDQTPRELTIIFNNSTITFEPGQKIRYEGLEGLKYLKINDSISVSSMDNIRGITEFIAHSINKI